MAPRSPARCRRNFFPREGRSPLLASPSCFGDFRYFRCKSPGERCEIWHEACRSAVGRSYGTGERGLASGPCSVTPDGNPLLWRSKRYNVSFIFGVLQAEQLRACDDLEHSAANLTCTVETPTHLLSRDNIAQLSEMLAAGGGDWAMFKAYRKAAYKQLPIDPDGENAAIISPRHPTERRWYGCVTRP